MSDGGDKQDPNSKHNIHDTTSSSKKCPECDAPVDDVRVTCPRCGYEYKPEDHESDSVGHEFTAGTAVDDEGNEVSDHPTGN